MEVAMLKMLERLAACARKANADARRPRAEWMLGEWDQRLLRDIGLTRVDVLACLSSPWDNPDAFLHVHDVTHLHTNVQPVRDADRLAA
jgi:uncharacterized protein YjiS (DUF1127 family)